MQPVTPKPKAGKHMPYFCSNHRLPESYQYCYPTKSQSGGGYRWLVHKYFVIRDDVVTRVNNPIGCKQSDFVKDTYLTDTFFPRALARDDLRPVLDTKLTGEGLVENSYWELTTLPPDPAKNDDLEVVPGELPNRACFDPIGDGGLVICKVDPAALGWCLFRFQDFDTNLEWFISLKEAMLYLKERGEIKALIKLLQLEVQ